MPIYEFKCNACGSCFETIVRASDDNSSLECPTCGSRDHERLLSSFARCGGQSGTESCKPSGSGFG